jgi:hypothetical protein
MSNKQKIGRMMQLMGVLAWAPFLYLAANGQKPPLYPFLAVHLIGVVGGARLHRWGNIDQENNQYRRVIFGRILILLGVLAWAPYFYQKNILDVPVEIGLFLAAHLTGVLSGIALLLSVPVGNYIRKLRQDQLSEDSLAG